MSYCHRRCSLCVYVLCSLFFFFNDTATTEIYTLSLHDALPICEADHRAFEAWRARADVHEQAWLRALAVSQRAGSLPPTLGAPALARKQRRLGAVGRRDTARALALLITAAPVGCLAWRAAPCMS